MVNNAHGIYHRDPKHSDTQKIVLIIKKFGNVLEGCR